MIKRTTRKPTVKKTTVKATKDQIVEKVCQLINLGDEENFFEDLCSSGEELLNEVRTLLEMEKPIPEMRFILITEPTSLNNFEDFCDPDEYEITIKHKKSGKVIPFSLEDIEADIW